MARVISYLGPRGTYSHAAAEHAFAGEALVPASTIDDVFDAVRRGDAEAGVVPIENSTEGGVTQAADALLLGRVSLAGEVILPIEHALVARPGSTIASIRRVHSHPQALAQCRRWLRDHVPAAELVAWSSTAAAAGSLRTAEDAAIGSTLLAAVDDLVVLRCPIQDREENATRFVVLAREDAARTGHDKTSVVLTLRHERGALRRALSAFEDADVNLTRIESRPLPGAPWHYVFLVDVEGHRTDDRIMSALARLGEACEDLRVVGSYPAAAVPVRLPLSSAERSR